MRERERENPGGKDFPKKEERAVRYGWSSLTLTKSLESKFPCSSWFPGVLESDYMQGITGLCCTFLANVQAMLQKCLSLASVFCPVGRSAAKFHILIILFRSSHIFFNLLAKRNAKALAFSQTGEQTVLLCDDALIQSTAALIMIKKWTNKKPTVENLDLCKAFCTNNDLGALYSRVREKQTSPCSAWG